MLLRQNHFFCYSLCGSLSLCRSLSFSIAYVGHSTYESSASPDIVKSASAASSADLLATEDCFLGDHKKSNGLSLSDDSPPAFSASRTRLTIDTDSILDSCGPLVDDAESGKKSSLVDDAESGKKSSLVDDAERGKKSGNGGTSEPRMGLLSPTAHSDAGSDTLTTISLTSDRMKREGEDKKKEEEEANLNEGEEGKEERSRKYVAEFLEKYVLDTRVDSEVSLIIIFFFFSIIFNNL